jgi:hypothetical protein
MGGSPPLRKGWERLLSAWTRNDGKPREEWAPGIDLKEAVLIGLLMVVVTVMIGLAVQGLIRRV